jgi:hypothetical protein
MDCVQGKTRISDIADDAKRLLEEIYESERQCIMGLSWELKWE